MSTRKAPSTEEIITLFRAQQTGQERAIPYDEFREIVRGKFRTTHAYASKWLAQVLEAPASELVDVGSTAHGFIYNSALPELSDDNRLGSNLVHLTSEGYFAEENRQYPAEEGHWVLLRTTLASFVKRQLALNVKWSQQRKVNFKAELDRFKDRYGQDSIKRLIALLHRAHIADVNRVLEVHDYQGDEGDQFSLNGPYVTFRLHGGEEGEQDQIKAFLDLLATLGVDPL